MRSSSTAGAVAEIGAFPAVDTSGAVAPDKGANRAAVFFTLLSSRSSSASASLLVSSSSLSEVLCRVPFVDTSAYMVESGTRPAR